MSNVKFPIFLSCVLVVKNQSHEITNILEEYTSFLNDLVSDYELIIVDNASNDNSLGVLTDLTEESGLPNLQVYTLAKEVDEVVASWVGIENALGDFIAVINPQTDDMNFLPAMLDKAVGGSDIVLTTNDIKKNDNWSYQVMSSIFNFLYKRFTGIDISKEGAKYRVISKQVVNFIMQHPLPVITYRYLPIISGFRTARLTCEALIKSSRPKSIGEGFDRGMGLLISSTRIPLRFTSTLSLMGALANILYSFYVLVVAVMQTDVAPGWVTLSLQQSGMFFLITMVLFMLSEYILQMANLSNEGPLYYVTRELTSARITRREKLNIEVAVTNDK